MRIVTGTNCRRVRRIPTYRRVMRNWGLYVLLLPTLLYAAIFLYWPMYGILIAFKDYKASLGILGSPWTDQHGLKYFLQFFSSYSFEEIVGNTLRISVYYLLVSTPIPIAFALLLNYIERPGFKKVVQTVTYAPHFISTVVMCGMLFLLLAPTSGIINKMILALGGRSVFFLNSPEWFPHVYVWSGIWQHMGWDSIIYIAALSGISPELHEAGTVSYTHLDVYKRQASYSARGCRKAKPRTVLALGKICKGSRCGAAPAKCAISPKPTRSAPYSSAFCRMLSLVNIPCTPYRSIFHALPLRSGS